LRTQLHVVSGLLPERGWSPWACRFAMDRPRPDRIVAGTFHACVNCIANESESVDAKLISSEFLGLYFYSAAGGVLENGA
jgi:hypothetical protein